MRVDFDLGSLSWLACLTLWATFESQLPVAREKFPAIVPIYDTLLDAVCGEQLRRQLLRRRRYAAERAAPLDLPEIAVEPDASSLVFESAAATFFVRRADLVTREQRANAFECAQFCGAIAAALKRGN